MFADRLKQIRKEQGYTQVSLAKELGVSKGTVAMWETGKRTPSFEMLCTLSDLLNKRVDYILDHSDDDSSPKLTEEEIEQLGKWQVEDLYSDMIRSYLSLDEYGKDVVEKLIFQEQFRCREQGTLVDASDVKFMLWIE